MRRIVWFILCTALEGCPWSATTVSDTVAAQARVDLDCTDITVVEGDFDEFRARGCGRELMYGCVVRRRYPAVCTPHGSVPSR